MPVAAHSTGGRVRLTLMVSKLKRADSVLLGESIDRLGEESVERLDD